MFSKDPLKYDTLWFFFIIKVKKLARNGIIPNQIFMKEVAQITEVWDTNVTVDLSSNPASTT